MKLKKHRGIESLKSRYGLMFVTPWIIGLLLFFVYPIFQSLIYIFSDVRVVVGGTMMKWVGLDNINYIFQKDPDFANNLGQGLFTLLYTCPVILILSMIIGIMLSGQFKGRLFFRVVYFLPAIMAAGSVLAMLFQYQAGDVSSIQSDESVSSGMIDVSEIIAFTGLPQQIADFISTTLSGIMNIIWSCGIQIVLFISGMQTIPELLYEVGKVEGATKWEEFWFITLPMLSNVIVLVLVFTVVDAMTSQTDVVMTQAYALMDSQLYGRASAMLWTYFLCVGAATGLVLWLYNRFCASRWQ